MGVQQDNYQGYGQCVQNRPIRYVHERSPAELRTEAAGLAERRRLLLEKARKLEEADEVLTAEYGPSVSPPRS